MPTYSIIYLYAGRYDAAEAQARKTLEIDPRSFVAHYYLGAALQLTIDSRGDPGISKSSRAKQLILFYRYARPGLCPKWQQDEARKLLTHLNEMAKSSRGSGVRPGPRLHSLGEKERAIEALEHGFAGGNKSYLFLLPGDPFLDGLRGDPRFEALTQKITGENNEDRQWNAGSRETSTGKPARVEERRRESINFFAELKRRNVYKVAGRVRVVAWLLVQIATQFFRSLKFRLDSALVVLVLIAGFPVSLVSPGLSRSCRKESFGSRRRSGKSIQHHTGKKIVALTIVLAIIAAGLLVFRLFGPKLVVPRHNEVATVIPEKKHCSASFDNLSEEQE